MQSLNILLEFKSQLIFISLPSEVYFIEVNSCIVNVLLIPSNTGIILYFGILVSAYKISCSFKILSADKIKVLVYSKLTASDKSVPGATFLICYPYIFSISDETI
jgi:hypothetical protein